MTSHDLVEQGLAAPRPATRVPSYSWTHRALETTAIVVVVVLAVQAAFHVARAVNNMTLVWVFGGAMVTGYLMQARSPTRAQ